MFVPSGCCRTPPRGPADLPSSCRDSGLPSSPQPRKAIRRRYSRRRQIAAGFGGAARGWPKALTPHLSSRALRLAVRRAHNPCNQPITYGCVTKRHTPSISSGIRSRGFPPRSLCRRQAVLATRHRLWRRAHAGRSRAATAHGPTPPRPSELGRHPHREPCREAQSQIPGGDSGLITDQPKHPLHQRMTRSSRMHHRHTTNPRTPRFQRA
jgi:hypothetical protein